MNSLNDKCYEWLESNFPELKRIGKNYHFRCPSCNGKIGRSANYHYDTNTFRCFQSGCAFHRFDGWFSILDLIKFVEGEEYAKVFEILKKFRGFKKPKPTKLSEARRIALPNFFIPITKGEGILSERARESLTKRNFSLEYLQSLNVGYIKQSGVQYSGYIIIPFLDYYGKLVFFQARDFKGNQQRWDQPKEEEFGVGKSQVLYNEIQLKNNFVWLNEGCTDVWEMQQAVSSSGKTLSGIQLSKIAQSPTKEVYVCYDSGAYREALHAGYNLLEAGLKVKVLDMEGGDANSLGIEKVKYITSGTDFLSFPEYLKQLANLRIEGQHTYKGKTGKIIQLW